MARGVQPQFAEPDPLQIGVLLAWSPLDVHSENGCGQVIAKTRRYGLSEADKAALELALELGDAWGASVRAVCIGPKPAEDVCRRALELGIDDVVRVHGPPDCDQGRRGEVLANVVGGCGVVLAGTASPRCGSGSVPGFVAHHLQAASAAGIVSLSAGAPGLVVVERRLDGGRREQIELLTPCVVSVEGSAATLRGARSDQSRAARDQDIPVCDARDLGRPLVRARQPTVRVPFRTGADPTPGSIRPLLPSQGGSMLPARGAMDRTAVRCAEPRAAAVRLINALKRWGYL